MFTLTQNRWKIDDVLGVLAAARPVRRLGGIACGIFGSRMMGGLGGSEPGAQLIGTLAAIAVALIGGGVVYGLLRATVGIRLDAEEEYAGADITIHNISATPERESPW